jgi:hypothetical protein
MRRLARFGFAAALVGATALMSGCESLDSISLFDSKTKLPGDRKAVFPEGVPGVTPGVPPEMVKGYHEPVPETPPTEAAEARPKPAEAKPKAAEAKPKPKPHTVQSAAKPQPAPSVQAATAPPPPPASSTAAAPWPNQPQQAQPQGQAPWPPGPASR